MGFNRGEIRVKAMNFSVVYRKGEEYFLECRVVNGAITDTVSAHSHLHGGVTDVPRYSLHPTVPGTGGHMGRSTHAKKKEEVCTVKYIW